MPGSISTNTPKSVIDLTLPLTVLPSGWLLRQLFPRIRFGLLEPERDAPVGLVDAQHLDLDHVADVDHLRGMHRALAPAHLGDVDQPLDALLQLDERAVVGDADDLALEPRADRIALGRLASTGRA